MQFVEPLHVDDTLACFKVAGLRACVASVCSSHALLKVNCAPLHPTCRLLCTHCVCDV